MKKKILICIFTIILVLIACTRVLRVKDMAFNASMNGDGYYWVNVYPSKDCIFIKATLIITNDETGEIVFEGSETQFFVAEKTNYSCKIYYKDEYNSKDYSYDLEIFGLRNIIFIL